ncbi:ECF-type sigma factor [Fontivita pretiosa]|uniref:ECF-type sigma factor n=1 Tax=Fontivita pretiosa TaxID=2989684 RepID=UPI003D173F5E
MATGADGPSEGSGTHDRGDSRLLAEVYDQLRAIARNRLAHEAPGHTLQATALVNEAYLKLCQHSGIFAADKSRFVVAAAEAMRRILIDHARTRKRIKRGGGQIKRSAADISDVAELAVEQDPDQIMALDEAICRLEQQDRQAAQVVKLRFFAGLSVQETADAMGISSRTVKREWQFARAWLFNVLKDDTSGPR